MLFKVFKIICVIVYVTLAVEVLFRVMAPVPMQPRYVSAAPYGIRGNTPNQTYRHSTAEYKITIQTNSRGIRSDRDIPYDKPDNVYRIVLLGDSFGMGYGVNAEEMFTARMLYYLKRKYGINAEVVNLSTSGHGNAEELIVLQNEGIKYHPDLVLLAWHNTDLDDNIRSALFELTDDGILQRKKETYLPGVKEREFLQGYWIYRYMDENSQIYSFFRNWAASKVKRWLAKVRFKAAAAERGDLTAKMRRRNYKETLSIEILKKIRRESLEAGAQFVLLDIPYRVSRTEFTSRFPLDDENRSEYFHVVSPIAQFKEKAGQLLYWEKGDGHFTPLGCDIVGEVLADYVQRHGLLENGGLHPGQGGIRPGAKGAGNS